MVKYTGGEADFNVIDAAQYGESMHGVGRLYVSVAYFCTHGEVLAHRQKADIKCYASEVSAGCFETGVIIAASAAQMPLFGDLYKPYLDWLIGKIAEYIKDNLTGRGNVEKLVEAITEQAAKSDELNHLLANGLLKATDDMSSAHIALIEKLPELVDANRGHMKRVVSPVGRSCSEMKHFSDSESEFTISEAEAEAIRSKDDLEVDDVKNYRCDLISELNTKTGHCHLHIEGMDKHVIGKISDPVLQEPNNIYSEALNYQSGFYFTAKAVLKDGEIHRLYVSDAKIA